METNRRSRSSLTGRSMSMPVQAQGNSDNGFHMVALTSSTYGILKTDTPKKDGTDIKSLSISNSAHDAFYEKLKNFDVPDEMVAKPWSEVSRNLPIVPPLSRTDSPRRTDSLRRMDSPRQARGIDSPRQARGTDSPRQTGVFRETDSPRLRANFRRTDSPRRLSLPSQATKNDHETINMWELMDGLEEDGTNPAKPKFKLVERIPRSPMIKTFERSITFSTIHTLSELDSGDPSKAITSGPANNVLNNSESVDIGGKENAKPVRVMPRSMSSPIVQKRDEITVRLTPSSPSLVPRIAVPSSDPPRPKQPSASPMTLTSEANGTIQEVSKALLPPPSPAPRVAVPSSGPPRPRQPSVSPMTLPPEANATIQEVRNALLPPPSPLLSSTGTKNANVTQVRNRPPGLQPSKSTVVKVENSPMSLNVKLEAEIEKAMSEERGVNRGWVQSTATSSMEPDLGHVRAVASSLSQEVAGARPQPAPKRVDVKETSNQATRQIPRFASPIHVLSLAASFDLENRKNSMSHLDLKGPPMSPSPATMKAGGRQSFSKQQSMPSPSLRAIPSSGQGVGLQSQASAPPGNHGSLNASVAPVREGISAGRSPAGVSERGTSTNAKSSLGGTPIDSDLLASFEEALEMFSADEWCNVRDSKGEAIAVSDVAKHNGSLPTDMNGMSPDELEKGVSGDRGGQGNGDKGANIHLAAQGEATASESSSYKGIAVQKRVKPDPWARFEMKCPPAGEDRVVLYTTSLRGIRKTFEDCNNVRFIFQSFNVEIDERDVSIHAEFRQELKELSEKPVPVPQAFIKGRYIGGMDIITQLHEDGTLATLVDDLPPQLSRGECDGCGGVRFVPCSDCSGSTKIVNEAKEVVRCGECNENGLMRCPICY